MPTTDPRVDAYIAEAREFARPILRHLRAIVHEAYPETIETMKWRFPHFEHPRGIVCSMAAFKAHCVFGFARPEIGERLAAHWNGKTTSAWQLGRIESVDELPPKRVLADLVRAAVRLAEAGPSPRRPPRVARRSDRVAEETPPEDLAAALAAAPAAREGFAAMSPGHRREYVAWIAGAKRPETRERRIAQAVEQLSRKRSLHWKYERPKKA